MENVGKLVDTINSAIQKAGGEAARVWPDMVASYAMSAWLAASGFAALALVLVGVSAFALRQGFRYQPKNAWDDGRGVRLSLAAFAFVLAMFAAGICTFNIPAALYPEANLVKSLLR